MREEDKLNKAIKQDGMDTQSEILEELKRRYPQYVKQADTKQAPASKRKFAFISAIAAVAVCVAVVVPCAVLLPDKNNGSDNGGKEHVRYCTQADYEKSDVQYTIGEYRANNKRSFLYFDWYEYGEDVSTVCYISNLDNDVLGLTEQAYLPQTDEVVLLSLTKANIYLSEFDVTIANCKNRHSVENHTVKWTVDGEATVGIFEHSGYRYFIQIKQVQDENRLFDLVTELLETK